jgi:3-hydroxyacyl-CoA dehydrogenase
MTRQINKKNTSANKSQKTLLKKLIQEESNQSLKDYVKEQRDKRNGQLPKAQKFIPFDQDSSEHIEDLNHTKKVYLKNPFALKECDYEVEASLEVPEKKMNVTEILSQAVATLKY